MIKFVEFVYYTMVSIQKLYYQVRCYCYFLIPNSFTIKIFVSLSLKLDFNLVEILWWALHMVINQSNQNSNNNEKGKDVATAWHHTSPTSALTGSSWRRRRRWGSRDIRHFCGGRWGWDGWYFGSTRSSEWSASQVGTIRGVGSESVAFSWCPMSFCHVNIINFNGFVNPVATCFVKQNFT